MTKEELLRIAQAEAFEKVAILPTAELAIHHEYRSYCEENLCGNYNRNYGCPPGCGTPAFMEERVRRYEQVLVLQSRVEMDDLEDKALIAEVRKEHNRMSRAVLKQLEAAGMPMQDRCMLPGPCAYCESCAALTGEPCRFPEKKSSCLSAYGIDVTALAERCGMRIDWQGGSVSYFTLYLF